MTEIILKILEFLGILAIPSICWGVYVYKQNKKYKKWDAEREIKKLNIQKEKIKFQYGNKRKELYEYIGSRKAYRDLDTASERLVSFEDDLEKSMVKENNEVGIIDADIEYYQKFLREKTPPTWGLPKDTLIDKIKRIFKNLYKG